MQGLLPTSFPHHRQISKIPQPFRSILLLYTEKMNQLKEAEKKASQLVGDARKGNLSKGEKISSYPIMLIHALLILMFF